MICLDWGLLEHRPLGRPLGEPWPGGGDDPQVELAEPCQQFHLLSPCFCGEGENWSPLSRVFLDVELLCLLFCAGLPPGVAGGLLLVLGVGLVVGAPLVAQDGCHESAMVVQRLVFMSWPPAAQTVDRGFPVLGLGHVVLAEAVPVDLNVPVLAARVVTTVDLFEVYI